LGGIEEEEGKGVGDRTGARNEKKKKKDLSERQKGDPEEEKKKGRKDEKTEHIFRGTKREKPGKKESRRIP